jgi:hypothetical protein
VFGFAVDAVNITMPTGEYLVFLFEIRMEGLRREIEFSGIPIETHTESIVKTQFEVLPRILAKTTVRDLSGQIKDFDINLLLEKARNYLEEVLEEKRNAVSQDNRYKVESRIAALSKSSEKRIMGLEEQKSTHIRNRHEDAREPDINYLRLTDARIEKEQSRLKSKIEDLRKHQDLSVDYSLEAIVYLEAI